MPFGEIRRSNRRQFDVLSVKFNYIHADCRACDGGQAAKMSDKFFARVCSKDGSLNQSELGTYPNFSCLLETKKLESCQ
jgi:hypothetical protein